MAQQLTHIALAGGCFWCTQAIFSQVRGVHRAQAGYSNGHVLEPSYEQVCSATTGHAEVVHLGYDPTEVGVRTLLDIFFATHDPTTPNRQGNDVGPQYRSAIFWTEPQQAHVAQTLMAELVAAGRWSAPIVTQVEPLRNYAPAESEHQAFFASYPTHGYCAAVVAPKVAKLQRDFSNWCR